MAWTKLALATSLLTASVDIVVALDVSGSMGGSKLQLCKRTLELLLRTLGTGDRFALVTYASDVRVDIPVREMNETNKVSAIETVKGLTTRGCTNISAAIGMAFQEMRRIETPNKVQTIFLLTDGMANEGITDDDGLVELSRNCLLASGGGRKRTSGGGGFLGKMFSAKKSSDGDGAIVDSQGDGGTHPITMHTFGYGSDHRSELLGKLASVTPGGSYYFVEDDSAVGAAFGDALGGVLSVVAQGITLTIQPPLSTGAPEDTILKVHHDQAIQRGSGSYTVHFNDMYAEETRDVLFEVKLLKPADGDNGEQRSSSIPVVNHANVTLSYTDTVRKVPVESDPVECLVACPVGSEVGDADPYVKKQWLRLCAVREMKTAQEKARRGNLASARGALLNWQRMAKQECEDNEDLLEDAMVMQLRSDMDDLTAGLSSEREYKFSASKKMTNLSNQHYRQRCSASSVAAPNVYRSKKKTAMAMKLTK